MTQRHSIRVLNYWADSGNATDVIVIGPYPTEAARDTDLARLAELPGVFGVAGVRATIVDPALATYHVTPRQVAEVANLAGLLTVIYGKGKP